MKDIEKLREILLEIQSRLDQAFELLGEAETVDWQKLEGLMSTFGGPEDSGVSSTEGLALCEPSEVDEFPEELFLTEEQAGAPGLARRLNPDYAPGYIACRWDYDVTSRDWLQSHTVAVRNPFTGRTVAGVQPIDWGPNEKTGRVADLSPGLAEVLELATDDACEVMIPIPAAMA